MRPSDYAVWAGASATFPALLYGYGECTLRHAHACILQAHLLMLVLSGDRIGRPDKVDKAGHEIRSEARYNTRLLGRLPPRLPEEHLCVTSMAGEER